MQKLDLCLESGRPFYYHDEQLNSLVEELEEFLEYDKKMNSLEFAKKVMFSHELQANNLIEGYGDDMETIKSVISKKAATIRDENQRLRILNLYEGYQYILEHQSINKNSLKELYSILSKGLLEAGDLARMGDIYRLEPVYILFNGRLENNLEEGAKADNIEFLMEKYFEFLNSNFGNETETDEYIKSQILHYYFVYIHPFYDVNGRTSRTLAMWYLLNNEAYSYIIFNRGIRNSLYDKIIKETKTTCNLTKFLNYMLDSVKKEMEKECVIQNIASNINSKLNGLDYQTLLYFLSINGLITVKDFTAYYNRINDKKKAKEIFEEMLLPLIDLNIINIDSYSKKIIFDETPNMILSLNKNKIDVNPEMIRRIKF